MMSIAVFLTLFIIIFASITLFGYWGLLVIAALVIAVGSWALYTTRWEDMP